MVLYQKKSQIIKKKRETRRENNTLRQLRVLCSGKTVSGRLGSIWTVISKLKVNTRLFTNDLVNFPYIYFGLLYLRREILNVFASGPY